MEVRATFLCQEANHGEVFSAVHHERWRSRNTNATTSAMRRAGQGDVTLGTREAANGGAAELARSILRLKLWSCSFGGEDSLVPLKNRNRKKEESSLGGGRVKADVYRVKQRGAVAAGATRSAVA